MKFVRESGAVLFNDQLIYLNVGNAGQVDFHFGQIWPIVRVLLKTNYNKRLSTGRNEVEFLHVHPDGVNDFSIIDFGLIKAWVVTLPIDVSVVFSIICERKYISYICQLENGNIYLNRYSNCELNAEYKNNYHIYGLLQKLSYEKE